MTALIFALAALALIFAYGWPWRRLEPHEELRQISDACFALGLPPRTAVQFIAAAALEQAGGDAHEAAAAAYRALWGGR